MTASNYRPPWPESFVWRVAFYGGRHILAVTNTPPRVAWVRRLDASLYTGNKNKSRARVSNPEGFP
jgi:hypothetical protein